MLLQGSQKQMGPTDNSCTASSSPIQLTSQWQSELLQQLCVEGAWTCPCNSKLTQLFLLQSLIMENTHTFPVEYEWVMSSQNSVFSVSPASGTIKPKSSCSVVVRWAPGHAAPTEKTKAVTAVTAADAVVTIGRPGSVSRASTKEGGKASHPNASTALDKSKVVIDANVQSNTAVTVNLTGTGSVDAAAVADAASLGCQQTGFMSLKLKGGADAAPKKVMLLGEMPAG